ncbi:hypothetical protein [Moorena sp. SIO4A5]|nr:hypothetical protein [Moorena sp. SIO4A5]
MGRWGDGENRSSCRVGSATDKLLCLPIPLLGTAHPTINWSS